MNFDRIEIKYTRDALKFLDKQAKKDVTRIREAIYKLKKYPPEGDIKSLQGYSDGRKRLRVGKWRVIYKHNTEREIEVILIIDIDNRGDIYK
jgi:mRNA interferase RelE/StbE